MIEQIKGVLVKKIPTFCVIDCCGIGLGLNITVNTFKQLADEKNTVTLLSYLYVREDALQLFGFVEEQERDFFKKLISISGVGPRLAMTILSGLSVEELRGALIGEDIERLTRVPGVGRKTAQRVALELKEKLDLPDGEQISTMPQLVPEQREMVEEAFQALMTLGYKMPEARKTLEKVLSKHGKELKLEDLIKFALREM